MVKIKLNSQGVKALLRSSAMKGIIDKHAQNIQARCGDGFNTSHKTTDRVSATVYAETIKARKRNAEENTILKALK